MTTQPDALRLAGALLEPVVLDKHAMQAADELLRLHAECEALRKLSADRLEQITAHRQYALRWHDECEALRMERDALRAAANNGGWMGYFDDAARAAKEQCNG